MNENEMREKMRDAICDLNDKEYIKIWNEVCVPVYRETTDKGAECYHPAIYKIDDLEELFSSRFTAYSDDPVLIFEAGVKSPHFSFGMKYAREALPGEREYIISCDTRDCDVADEWEMADILLNYFYRVGDDYFCTEDNNYSELSEIAKCKLPESIVKALMEA